MKWLKSLYQKRKNKQIVHSFLSISVNCNINKEWFLSDCQLISRLRLPRSVIALKFSWQFFNQWETKPKSIAPYKRDLRIISALRKLQANAARDSDWFIALFALLWLVGVITIVFDTHLKTVLSWQRWCQSVAWVPIQPWCYVWIEVFDFVLCSRRFFPPGITVFVSHQKPTLDFSWNEE